MDTDKIMQLTDQAVMHTYGRLPIAFVKGEGTRLWDSDGNEYLDFVAGIAVLSVGHSHPKIVEAICEQAGTIMHTSNLYHIPQQAELAAKLSELSFGGKSFFCNSGAEANEAAIKLARKWAGVRRPDIAGENRVILTTLKSFHGRSVTTITATGQDKYQTGFEPLAPGFRYFEFGNIEDATRQMDSDVCAIMIEPIQAEGGMNVPPPGFLAKLRELCDARRCLLIFDEVQTGMARTGQWFGYMHEGVEPDVMTLAKALGSGYPIGCCMARPDVADTFEPGNHASTFGGSHMACAVALATIEIMETEGLVENAAEMGVLFEDILGPNAHPKIAEMRGRGLLRAVRFQEGVVDARAVQDECLKRGLVVNAIGEDRLRLAPPLNLSEADARQAAGIILEAVDAIG